MPGRRVHPSGVSGKVINQPDICSCVFDFQSFPKPTSIDCAWLVSAEGCFRVNNNQQQLVGQKQVLQDACSRHRKCFGGESRADHTQQPTNRPNGSFGVRQYSGETSSSTISLYTAIYIMTRFSILDASLLAMPASRQRPDMLALRAKRKKIKCLNDVRTATGTRMLGCSCKLNSKGSRARSTMNVLCIPLRPPKDCQYCVLRSTLRIYLYLRGNWYNMNITCKRVGNHVDFRFSSSLSLSRFV